MKLIRLVEDLREHFADISMEAFESLQYENELFVRLHEAEQEAESTARRYSSREALDAMRKAAGGEPVV